MIRRPPRSTLFPTRRSSDLISRRSRKAPWRHRQEGRGCSFPISYRSNAAPRSGRIAAGNDCSGSGHRAGKRWGHGLASDRKKSTKAEIHHKLVAVARLNKCIRQKLPLCLPELRKLLPEIILQFEPVDHFGGWQSPARGPRERHVI